MHPTSELILRNCGSGPSPRPDRVLLINPPQDSLVPELSRATEAEVAVFTQDFGDQQFFTSGGITSTFGLLPDSEILPGHIILFLPREKERLEFLLHFLAVHMPENGTLWLVGENKAGIKSAETRLQQRFAQVQKVDAARHCVLYQAVRRSGPLSRPATDQVGSMAASHSDRSTPQDPTSAFKLEDYWQHWTLPTQAGELKLQSLPGSFAHGRLDKGTALMLDFLQSAEGKQLKIRGPVIDFGCGVGVIGLLLKQQNPQIRLTLLDSSASALDSARASLPLNQCEAEVIAADGLNAIKGRFDWIISNPPFHKGVATDLDVARRMIARAPALLGNRGKMLLVVNRHLPYEAWLDESFGGHEKVAQNHQFKVLLSRRGPIGGKQQRGRR